MIFYLESWGKIGYSEKDSTACKYNDTMCFLGICVCTFVYIVLYKYSAWPSLLSSFIEHSKWQCCQAHAPVSDWVGYHPTSYRDEVVIAGLLSSSELYSS